MITSFQSAEMLGLTTDRDRQTILLNLRVNLRNLMRAFSWLI